jgi:hypothetical protein
MRRGRESAILVRMRLLELDGPERSLPDERDDGATRSGSASSGIALERSAHRGYVQLSAPRRSALDTASYPAEVSARSRQRRAADRPSLGAVDLGQGAPNASRCARAMAGSMASGLKCRAIAHRLGIRPHNCTPAARSRQRRRGGGMGNRSPGSFRRQAFAGLASGSSDRRRALVPPVSIELATPPLPRVCPLLSSAITRRRQPS